MAPERIDIAVEVSPKRAFAWASPGLGWCRGGKDADLAIESLIEHGGVTPSWPRAKSRAPRRDRRSLPARSGAEGGVGPSSVSRRPSPTTTAFRDDRRKRPGSSVVEAAWTGARPHRRRHAANATRGPARRRPRPRQDARPRHRGRPRLCARDGRLPTPSFDDRPAVEAERAAILEVLRRSSDGSPLADRRWTPPLRRPPDRVARPRPRLGDGGPHRVP